MKKYVKKPVVIEAVQWFKNGDHPHDACSGLYSEGKIVRYYRRPEIRGGCLDGQVKCKHCDDIMHNHGWIDTLEGGHIVCPGDWVIRGVKGEYYPCKPDIFEQTYSPLDEEIDQNLGVSFFL